MIPLTQFDFQLSQYRNHTVVIWGSGYYGALLLDLFKQHHIEVLAFCDSSAERRARPREGLPVISPETLKQWQETKEHGDILVQIAVLGKDKLILQQVEEVGISMVVCGEGVAALLRCRLDVQYHLRPRCCLLKGAERNFLLCLDAKQRERMKVIPLHRKKAEEKAKKYRVQGLFQNRKKIRLAPVGTQKLDVDYPVTCVLNLTQDLDFELKKESVDCVKKQGFSQVIVFTQDKARDATLCEGLSSKVQIYECESSLFTVTETLRYVVEENLCENAQEGHFVLLFGGDLFHSDFSLVLQFYLRETKAKLLTGNETRLLHGRQTSPFYKQYLLEWEKLPLSTVFRRLIVVHGSMLESLLEGQVEREEITLMDGMLYHARLKKSSGHGEKTKLIAYYLPQFHRFPENDAWWGDGFTEWTNTKRGYPLFDGHYQPHEPADELGFYDIVEDETIIPKQVALAKEYGIHGFCFYYYWFAGKKLMEKPIERILKDKSIELPFCIFWANENWTRTWDGNEAEVLIGQEHSLENDMNFIYDVMPLLKDERYIRVDGAPLLVVYREELMKNTNEITDHWRKACKAEGIENLKIAFVQSRGFKNPLVVGGDYGLEFPPYQLSDASISPEEIQGLHPDFTGTFRNYKARAREQAQRRPLSFPVFRGTMLGWDNTARRLERATLYHNFSLDAYEEWLAAAIDFSSNYYKKEEQFVFINAWNEWAEGAHLEPDKKYGRKQLETTKKALEYDYFKGE